MRYLRYNWRHNGWYCSHRFGGKLSHVIRNNPSPSVTRYHRNVSRQSCCSRPFAILVWNAADSRLSFPQLLDLWTHLVLHKWSNKLSLLHRLHVNTVCHWFRPLVSDCLSVTSSIVSHFPEGETSIDVYLGTGVSCGDFSRIWMVKVTTKLNYSVIVRILSPKSFLTCEVSPKFTTQHSTRSQGPLSSKQRDDPQTLGLQYEITTLLFSPTSIPGSFPFASQPRMQTSPFFPLSRTRKFKVKV